MDKIEKFLRKLRPKEQEAILLMMLQIRQDFRKVPGITALQGKQNFYRVRCGRYRLIFSISGKKIEIIRITKGNEKTYKNL